MEIKPFHILLIAASGLEMEMLQALAPEPRFRWMRARQLDAALEMASRLVFDTLVVSRELADAGLEPLARASGGVPIIVLAPRYSEADALHSMESGAWGYLALDQLDRYTLTSSLSHAAEQHRLKLALVKSNEQHMARKTRLREIIDSDMEGAVVIDTEHRVRYMNRAAERLFGYTANEMLGLPLKLRFAFGKLTETKWQQPSGNTVWVDIRTVETDLEGQHVYILFLRDISARKRAEQALRRLAQENSQFAAALANLSTGVVITTPTADSSTIVFVNRGFTEMTGYTAEEVYGRDASFLQGKDTDPATLAEIAQAMAEGRPFKGVILNYRKDGTPFWNELTIDAVYDIEGRLVNYVGLQMDVTARITAENELRRYNERLQILHDIDRAILSFDSLERIAKAALGHLRRLIPCQWASILMMNADLENMQVLASYSERETQIQSGKSIPFPMLEGLDDLRAGHTRYIPDLTESQESSLLTELLGVEGLRSHVVIPLLVQDSLVGIFNLGAREPDAFSEEDIELAREVALPFAVAVSQEALYRQIQDYAAHLELRVEQRTDELRRAEERARAIFNNTSDAILILRADGTVQQANPAFEEMFGWLVDAALDVHVIEFIPPVYVPEILNALHAILMGSPEQRLEIVTKRGMQEAFSADWVMTPFTEPDTHKMRVLCSVRDITERKQIEEDLRDALRKEKELNELKMRFTSMVSHEFRVPLATIRTATDLIKRYHHHLTEERRLEAIRMIQDEVRRLTEMLDDMLLIARAQSLGIPFNAEVFELEDFCRQTVEEVNQATDYSHEIIFRAKGECGEVCMDRKLIRHLITNLLTNAVKYSPAGSSITFELRCDPMETILRVADQGIGIPEADQPYLFEPFHRSSNVGTRQGTGLGLAIAKQAVDLHNGIIELDSHVGEGTTITVRLPSYPATYEPHATP